MDKLNTEAVRKYLEAVDVVCTHYTVDTCEECPVRETLDSLGDKD